MIRNYPQFINWHIVVEVDQKTGKPIERKVPFDPATGYPIDPHNPANWKTYQAALATNSALGFVLTAQDPFFFLDLDKCRDPNGWIQPALDIFNQFPGAACEVSHSGNGLHIMGICDKIITSDRRHKFGEGERQGVGHWKEFYIQKRFVAFGRWGWWQGNFNVDCTAAIMRVVPKSENAGVGITELTDAAVIEYTGPIDDNELIAKMLSSRGSIAAAFGNSVRFEHLWNAQDFADVLSQKWPSPSGRDVYDRSMADGSLMAHLAFWTGKNPARMDRLFRRSGLMRPKYAERPDTYALPTISGAIAKCAKVYDLVKSAPDLPDAPINASEFLTIGDQVSYFQGCIYIRDQHSVLVPSGEVMSPSQFNVFYGGKVFQMSADNGAGGSTKKAFEAFTENRGYHFPKVHGTCFRPKMTPHAIIDGKVNIYKPFDPRRVAGDPAPFLHHMSKLLPVEHDRALMLAYMASLAQNPGVKFQWAPVIQGVQGNGKTIITEVMEFTVGEHFTHRPAAEDLTNSFNAYLDNKLLIAVEEIHTEGRREVLDVLKPLITNNRVETQPKGINKRMVDNFTNWLFLTNYHDAVPKTRDDRRYGIFFTAQQTFESLARDGMGGNYFPALYHWLREQDGKAIVADFLLRYQVPVELDPAKTLHRAPETSTTAWAIEASAGRIEQEILECVAAGDVGFRGGWISSIRLDALFKEKNIRLNRYKIGEMLRLMGYQQVLRAQKMILDEDMKRPVLYIRRDMYDPTLDADAYCTAQGYKGHFKPTIVYPLPVANQNRG